MTHKEENIVNIAMRAAELLQEGRIQRSEMTGHAGLTDTIISLAEEFEREYAGVDFDAERRDYWLEIDAFAEQQLLKELGVEHPEPSQNLADQNRDDESLCEVVAVVGNTEGGVVFQGTWDECREFCESNQWCFWDQNSFRWELETRDPNEDRIPTGFYTALEHYSQLEHRDIESGFIRDHAEELVVCYQRELKFSEFHSWTTQEAIVGEKLSYDEYAFLSSHLYPSENYADSMKASLSYFRADRGDVRPSLADQIKSAAETAAKAPVSGKAQEHTR